jgi:hypothetical protein
MASSWFDGNSTIMFKQEPSHFNSRVCEDPPRNVEPVSLFEMINPFTGERYRSQAEFVDAVQRARSGAKVEITPKVIRKFAPPPPPPAPKPVQDPVHKKLMEKLCQSLEQQNLQGGPFTPMSEREMAESRHAHEIAWIRLVERREAEATRERERRAVEHGKGESELADACVSTVLGGKNRRKREARRAVVSLTK